MRKYQRILYKLKEAKRLNIAARKKLHLLHLIHKVNKCSNYFFDNFSLFNLFRKTNLISSHIVYRYLNEVFHITRLKCIMSIMISIRNCHTMYEGVPKSFQNDAAARAVHVECDTAANFWFNHAFLVSVSSGIDAKVYPAVSLHGEVL